MNLSIQITLKVYSNKFFNSNKINDSNKTSNLNKMNDNNKINNNNSNNPIQLKFFSLSIYFSLVLEYSDNNK